MNRKKLSKMRPKRMRVRPVAKAKMGRDIGPTPDDPTGAALWKFVHGMNRLLPHALDNDQFYEFIVVAHKHSCTWNEIEVEKRLAGHYFLSKDLAKRYSGVYEVGRNTLLKQQRMEVGNASPVY